MKHLKTFESYGTPDFLQSIAEEIHEICMKFIKTKESTGYRENENNELHDINYYNLINGDQEIRFYTNSEMCKKLQSYFSTEIPFLINIKINGEYDSNNRYNAYVNCAFENKTFSSNIYFNTLEHFSVNNLIHELRHLSDLFYQKEKKMLKDLHNLPLIVFIKVFLTDAMKKLKYDKDYIRKFYIMLIKLETSAYYSQSVEFIKKNANKYQDYKSLANDTIFIKNLADIIIHDSLIKNIDKEFLQDLYNESYNAYIGYTKIEMRNKNVPLLNKEQFIKKINFIMEDSFKFAKTYYYRLYQVAKNEFDK